MALSTQVYILQDMQDGLPGLTLNGEWHRNNFFTYYYGLPALVPDQLNSSFTYKYSGTQVRFFGDAQDLESAQVKLDSGAPYNTSTNAKPLAYQQLYQTPILPNGDHSIQFTNLFANGTNKGIWFDCIVISPGSDTPLTGQTLMLDDTFVGIQYIGDWASSKDEIFVIDPSEDSFNGLALMNTSHRTSTIGSGLNISYTGTQLSIYGIVSWVQVGNFSLTYSVDGGNELVQNFTTNGTNTLHPYAHQPNTKLIDTGPVPAGNHTLSVTLSACNNQAFIIDYILYTPSFDTLASMPNLTAASSSSTTAGATTVPSPPETSNPSSSQSHAGAVAGGILGGIGFLVIACLVVFWYRRRQRRLATSSSVHATAYPVTRRATHGDMLFNPADFSRPLITESFNPSNNSPLVSTSNTTEEPTVSGASAGHGDNVQNLARKVQDLSRQMQQLQSARQDDTESRAVSANVDVEELSRGFTVLSHQLQHLQSLVNPVPPSYGH